MDPSSWTSTTIQINLRTTIWQNSSRRCENNECSRHSDFFLRKGERGVNQQGSIRMNCGDCWMLAENVDKRSTNLLDVTLEDFPMSASERWIGFLVWWRCFLSNTKVIFSFRSGGMRPSAICRSTMSSETKFHWFKHLSQVTTSISKLSRFS